jgi:FtsP/CotA-like multicopper oxidase with cupredoxin domain
VVATTIFARNGQSSVRASYGGGMRGGPGDRRGWLPGRAAIGRLLAVLIATAAAAAVVVTLASGAVPEPGRWVGHSTNGDVGSGKYGLATFKVSANHRRLLHFRIPEVGAYCFNGYQVITVAVPGARIRKGGRVRAAHVINRNPPDAKPTVHLKGRFKSKRTFRGEVTGEHYCQYDVRFVAHPHG